MKHSIVGIRAVEGTSKKTGKPFDSYILSTTFETQEVDAGIGVGEVFLDKSLLREAVQVVGSYRALVGMDINIDRNDRGFVVGVQLV